MKNIEKVLIIDDDKVNNFICTKIINLAGFANDVVGCISAKEGLDYLEKNSGVAQELPDIIFLDINMPIMNGWGFLEEYKKLIPNLSKDIVLFMLSSSVHKEDIKKANSYKEVASYVSKPLTVETLQVIQKEHFS